MQKINIVTYHYVRPIKKTQYPNLKGMELKKFIKQIDFLKKEFNIISYEDLVNFINFKKELPLKPCLLTFDDGYKDHVKYVLPILKKNRLTGCFFPAVSPIKYQRVLDVNKIQFILNKVKSPSIILYEIQKIIFKNKNFKKILDIKTLDAWEKKFKNKNRFDNKKTSFVKFLLQEKLTEAMRKSCCKILFQKFVTNNENSFSKNLYMSKTDIKKLISNGMHIGGHGYSHVRLGKLNHNEQKKEVLQNLKFLKSMGLNKNLSLCYPHGSYDKNTIKILKENNFLIGFTIKKGIATISKSNNFELKRFDCNDFLSI